MSVCAYFSCTYRSDVVDVNYHKNKPLMKDYVAGLVNKYMLI